MKDNMFKNRTEAGLLLSEQLSEYKNTNSVILAIPRGGVPVGYVIAKELQLPLSIVLSKKKLAIPTIKNMLSDPFL